MTGAVWASGMVAALFGLHPLHVESVAWVSERKDVLSGLFFGLTLWAYAAYAEGAAAFGLVMTTFALGLLSKPMLVTLPLLLLLLDYWPLDRWSAGTSRASLVIEKLPLLAMSAAICVVTYLVQRSCGAINEQAPLYLRVQTALLAYGGYLLKAFVPINLAASYPLRLEPAPLACAVWFLALACISLAAVLLARRGRGYAAVGWFWFLGMIAPVSGIVLIGDQGMADRYTYLSLTGLFIAVVFMGDGLLKGRCAALTAVACAAVLAVFAVLAIVQVGYWRDSETLWRRVLAVAPNNALAHSNLAGVIHDRGPKGKAEADFHIAEALRIRPDDALANNNFAIQLEEKGDWEGAARHCRIAVKSRPTFAPAHYNLGVALRSLDCAAEAESALRKALRLRPEYPEAENCLGVVLAMQGRQVEAVEHCRSAARLDPGVAQYHVKLGAALVKLGAEQGNRQLISEGVESCKTGIAMKPGDADAHNELARAYNAAGMRREAAAEWQKTFELRPHHAAALKEVGTLLVNTRHPAEALKFLTAAEAAAPRDIEVRRMKALTHSLMRKVPAAIAEYRAVLKLDPKDFQAMTSIAWFEATSPDKSIRNGKEAVDLAQRAAELQNPPTPQALDVLAAAYAETGRFKEAVDAEQKAKTGAAALEDWRLLNPILDRLKLYEAGKPYRSEVIAP